MGQFNRPIHVYYFTFFSLLGAVLACGVWHFWQNGPLNSENVSAAYEASLRLDELKGKNRIDEVKALVDSDRARDATGVLDFVQREAGFIHAHTPVEEYGDFHESLKKTKGDLNRLISLPQLSSLFLVFSNKISNFQDLVEDNNWRTLIRASKRARAKVHPAKFKVLNFFHVNKMSSLVGSVAGDIDLMKKVAEQAALSGQHKTIIASHLQGLDTEVQMLTRYIDRLRRFNAGMTTLRNAYVTWVSKVAPAVSLGKINLEKASGQVLWALLGVLGALLLILLGGLLTYGLVERGTRKKMELSMAQAIQEGLFPLDGKLDQGFSATFGKKMEKFRDYHHKRVSFGMIAQQALPFSTLLLDSNLNVIWANELFYKEWGLLERKSESTISWDYLSQFTNLGENDPVGMAVNQGVSGIYNIQVRNFDSPEQEAEESRPFEMYVSAVEYASHTRVMVFLYPLRNLEESISEQTKAIVGPVVRTLEAFVDKKYTEEFKSKVAKDFSVAGIEDVLGKFDELREVEQQDRNVLEGEIVQLEDDLRRQADLVDNLRSHIESDAQTVHKLKDLLKGLKGFVVESIAIREELQGRHRTTLGIVTQLLQKDKGVLDQSQQAIDVLQENRRAFDSIIQVCQSIKGIKAELDTLRGSLSGSADDGDASEVLQELDAPLAALSQVLQTLNIGLSKIELILERGRSFETEDHVHTLGHMREFIDGDFAQFKRLNGAFERSDDALVASLKDIYESFQDSEVRLMEMAGMVDQTRRETTLKI